MSDPFDIIAQNNAAMSGAARQDSANAQNALLQVFQEEAARQRPYAVLPAQLAGANIRGNNTLDRQVALENVKASHRRYGKGKGGKAKVDTAGLMTDQDATGETTYVLVNGKPVPIPKTIGEAVDLSGKEEE